MPVSLLMVFINLYFFAICPPTTACTVRFPTVDLLEFAASFISSTRTLPKNSLFRRASGIPLGFNPVCAMCAIVHILGVIFFINLFFKHIKHLKPKTYKTDNILQSLEHLGK